MNPNFRVRAESVEFLDSDGKVKSTRPATEQEKDMWLDKATILADLNSASQSNEAYRAQLERLFSGMRTLDIVVHPVEDAVERMLVEHERALVRNRVFSSEHKKLVDWAKAVANFQDGQGHSVVDLLINMLSNAYGPSNQEDLNVSNPKDIKAHLENPGEPVSTNTLRWDSEAPAHDREETPRLPQNPVYGTVAEVNGANMVFDGKEWRAMPVTAEESGLPDHLRNAVRSVQVADPAGESNPHWSDTTHD